jgi:hypothetical protein
VLAVLAFVNMPDSVPAEQKQPATVCQYATGEVSKQDGLWTLNFPALSAKEAHQRTAVCITNNSQNTAMVVVEFPADTARATLKVSIPNRTVQLSAVRCASSPCIPRPETVPYDPSTGRVVLGKLASGEQLVFSFDRQTTSRLTSLPATSLSFGVHFE